MRPQTTSFLVRANEAERLADYERALGAWLQHPGVRRIVLCENSGYDLKPFRDLCDRHASAGREVEFLSFVAPPFPKERGKGYGEMMLVEHAFERSALLKSSDLILKVTGRYLLKNGGEMLAACARSGTGASVVCNLKQHLTYADSRMFVATPDFYRRHLLPEREFINDSEHRYFEHALARAVHRAVYDGGAWRPLPRVVRFSGVEGSTGRRLDEGWWRYGARSLMCRVGNWMVAR